MNIELQEDGYIRGTYNSGVGTLYQKSYPLHGTYDKYGEAVGWTVSFQSSDSTCAWAGRAFMHNEQLRIQTTWLLSETLEKLWFSTHVGADLFNPANSLASKQISTDGVLRQSNTPKKLLEKQKN